MATTTHDAGHGAADAAHGSSGMPQLDFSTYGNQIFWLLVTLVVIYLILSRVALPRIAGILNERQGTITNDLAAAEDLKAKAVEAENAYNKALADARSEAQRIVAETRAEIQVGVDEAIAKADAEIAAKAEESEKAIAEIRATALDNVKIVASDTASALVAALGGKDDTDTIAAAVAKRTEV
ncbi:F0F1 ATP synthase subunit B' [Tritonibacter scottomollicae]|uniref:ATP synthase subunit b n=1 Tax=Tritonibacter scottomollicae TaxID=483013 RepID=A0A2T1AEH1_TRISK|nr:F0F1 ATP synthase subunit B' [Tritonibacter scottomollicae]PRZ46985.1 F-type H+-transporting ATPase subunit b [Tritonibacter scottomollicae]